MPTINLLSQNFIAAATSKAATVDDEPILDMNMDVYYVVWDRYGERFYMADHSSDGTQIRWTRNRANGFQFLDPEEAEMVARVANERGRDGVEVDMYEIQLDLELEG